MELNISQQYSQASQRSSLSLAKINGNGLTEKPTIDYQSAKHTSFKLSVEILTKSEINDQNSSQTLSTDKAHTENIPPSFSLQKTGNSSLNLFEDGYWGVNKTADRLANFVINGGGDNLEKIRMGREGIIRGFKEAEKMWGGQLPEISYKTLEKSLARIDERIRNFGEPVIDIAA